MKTFLQLMIATRLIFSGTVQAVPDKEINLIFDHNNCTFWQGVINEPMKLSFDVDFPKMVIINKAQHFYYLLPPSRYSLHGEDGFFLKDGNIRWFLKESGQYSLVVEGGYKTEESFKICLEV